MEHYNESKESFPVGETRNVNLKTDPGSWMPPVETDLNRGYLLYQDIFNLKNSMPDAVKALIADSLQALPTGSYFTVLPRPDSYSDIDIMLLVDSLVRTTETAFNLGAEVNAENYPKSSMKSVRFKEFNLLITEDPAYFYRWAVATDIARKLNITEKEDRAYLFERLTSM